MLRTHGYASVALAPCYDGYSWADLPRIIRVEVTPGAVKFEDDPWSHPTACVESLRIEAEVEDGTRFSQLVPMAVRPNPTSETATHGDLLYLTPDARELSSDDIWFHMGGPSCDGGSRETQRDGFESDLAEFWDRLVGPDETMRRKLFFATNWVPPGWRSLVILPDGTVEIRFGDGTTKTLSPLPPEGGEPESGAQCSEGARPLRRFRHP